MTEILFYHLTDQTLEQALPLLLEKCLDRDWRVVVQAGSAERLESLDAHLWTYREESFLPHSMIRDGTQSRQPIWLTADDDNPNTADVRFMIDAAVPPPLEDYKRAIYMFDGRDTEAVDSARERWKAEKDAGHDVTYWQQDQSGSWKKRA